MRYPLLYFVVFTAACISTSASAEESEIFPVGNKAPNVNHTGDVWLNEVSGADDDFDYNIALATFAPGAKLNWHVHPAGQQLLITAGVGYYQERGRAVQVVRKGDVVKCVPGEEHWHAAAPDSMVAYLAITGNERTQWLEAVTEDEYESIEAPAAAADPKDQLISLSGEKWQWMADKRVEKLASLFHDESVFVHMGGTWGKERELDVIRSGDIHYKKADVHEVSARVMGETGIVLNRITLLAVVGRNEVTNPFEVTEVYVEEGARWKLASLSFTRLLTD